jgi:hypothetical protein
MYRSTITYTILPLLPAIHIYVTQRAIDNDDSSKMFTIKKDTSKMNLGANTSQNIKCLYTRVRNTINRIKQVVAL